MNKFEDECMAEAINANVCMFGLIRKVAKQAINETQALIEIVKQLKRQKDEFKKLQGRR